MEFESVEEAQGFALIFGIVLILWGLSAIITKSITLRIGYISGMGYRNIAPGAQNAQETKKGKDAVNWGIFLIFIGAGTIYLSFFAFIV